MANRVFPLFPGEDILVYGPEAQVRLEPGGEVAAGRRGGPLRLMLEGADADVTLTRAARPGVAGEETPLPDALAARATGLLGAASCDRLVTSITRVRLERSKTRCLPR